MKKILYQTRKIKLYPNVVMVTVNSMGLLNAAGESMTNAMCTAVLFTLGLKLLKIIFTAVRHAMISQLLLMSTMKPYMKMTVVILAGLYS